MQHRLIMFAGSSPGAGKSTLSNLIFQQLTVQNLPVHWFYEEDLGHLPAFARFLHDLPLSHPEIELFLDAVAAFVPTCVALDKIIITDSFLPGHHFFFGSYPRLTLETFNRQVYQLLQPLQPLLVYLRSDISLAYARAIRQRGVVWQERMLRRMNTWQLPLYPHTPFRNLHDVMTFDQQIDEMVLALLAQWPGHILHLDTTTTPIEQVQAAILDYLGIVAGNVAYIVPPGVLASYSGAYALQDENAQPVLYISVRNDGLFVNTYWPNGTRLVAESPTRFRLEATNRRIEFAVHDQCTVDGLIYWIGNTPYRYRRMAE